MVRSADINVICLAKGVERYIWMYAERRRADVLRALCRAAANPELSLTWFDAVALSQKVRGQTELEGTI